MCCHGHQRCAWSHRRVPGEGTNTTWLHKVYLLCPLAREALERLEGTDLTGLVFARSCQDGPQPAHVCIFRCDPLGTKARGTKYRKTTQPGSALPAQRNTRCPWPGRVSLQLIGTVRPGGLMETTPPLSPEGYAGQIMSSFGNRLQKKCVQDVHLCGYRTSATTLSLCSSSPRARPCVLLKRSSRSAARMFRAMGSVSSFQYQFCLAIHKKCDVEDFFSIFFFLKAQIWSKII